MFIKKGVSVIVENGGPGWEAKVTDELQRTQRYGMSYTTDLSKVFTRVSHAAINLAMYVCDTYGERGEFSYGNSFVEAYVVWLTDRKVVPYHRITMDKSLRELKEYGFVLRYGRGSYAINPKYFFKGDAQMRDKRIQDLYEVSAKVEKIDIKNHNL